jgi:hypothetical protein
MECICDEERKRAHDFLIQARFHQGLKCFHEVRDRLVRYRLAFDRV